MLNHWSVNKKAKTVFFALLVCGFTYFIGHSVVFCIKKRADEKQIRHRLLNSQKRNISRAKIASARKIRRFWSCWIVRMSIFIDFSELFYFAATNRKRNKTNRFGLMANDRSEWRDVANMGIDCWSFSFSPVNFGFWRKIALSNLYNKYLFVYLQKKK